MPNFNSRVETAIPRRKTNHAADLFLRQSFRRIRRFLSDLSENEDKAVLATANSALGKVS